MTAPKDMTGPGTTTPGLVVAAMRAALIAVGLSGLSGSPVHAYEITPIAPQSGFPDGFDADILGLRIGMSGDEAISRLNDEYGAPKRKGHLTLAFPHTDVTFTARATGKRGSGNWDSDFTEVNFSSPASMNRAYVVKRTLKFSKTTPPTIQSVIDSLLDKYGVPSAVNAHGKWVYAYRDGEKIGFDADIIKPMIWNPEARKSLDSKTAVAIHELIETCSDKSIGLSGYGDSYQRIARDIEKGPCDAHIRIVLRQHANIKGRAGTLEITLADHLGRKSQLEIDGAAIKDAKQQALDAIPKGKTPKL